MLLKHLPYHALTMRFSNDAVYPRVALPAGYRFCTYTPALLPGWVALQVEVEHIDSADKAAALFQQEFLTQPALLQQRARFVLDDHREVAGFAALWKGELGGVAMDRIHWVAVGAAHQGRGLAKAMMTALLDMHQQQRDAQGIYLTSQTWSAKALRIYTAYGFQPCNADGSMPVTADTRAAWQIVEAEWQQYDKQRCPAKGEAI